ncbi:MAG: hypothetical protein M3354_09735 [Chloroflexota bacterium]|nr:hypothetical protein [Chloroflexota bacterium]
MSSVTTVDPKVETASAEGRILADPTATLAASEPGRRGLPFAARFQSILIGVMFAGFVLIAQGFSKTLYQIGLPLLVLAAFLQIAFGNIPPAANFAASMKLLFLTWVIVVAVFVLGILLAPFLIDL